MKSDAVWRGTDIMTITIGGWIGFLIGITVGCFGGLIAGVVFADRHWKAKSESIFGYKDSNNAPYEVEKRINKE